MNWDDANSGRPSPTGRPSLGDKVRSLRISDKQTGSASPNRLLPWGLCGILFVTTLAIGYRSYRLTPTDLAPVVVAAPTKSASGAGSRGGSAPPAAETGDLALEYKGYVIAPHIIQVSPKVGGMLEWIPNDLEEGRRFNAGDLLGIIENVDYKADRDQSLGNLKNLEAQLLRQQQLPRPEELPASKAKVREAEANLLDQRDQCRRAEQLFTQRVIGEEDLVKRRQAFLVAEHQLAARQAEYDLLHAGAWEPDLKAAESLVIKAQAELDRAQWKLDNTFIYAPISGTILTKKAEKGNLVNPSAYSNGLSASLCEMADLSDLEIELEIQERDIGRVVVQQPCRIVPEAYRDRVYDGYVARMMPQALRSKSAVVVRVKVTIPPKEEGVYLKPEMGAIVSFLKPKAKDTSVATTSPVKERK